MIASAQQATPPTKIIDTTARIVIVGAGFGGLAAAKALKRAGANVHRHRPHQSPRLPAAALPGGDGGAGPGPDRRAHPRRAG